MTENRSSGKGPLAGRLSRRTALKGLGASAGLTLAPGFVRYAQAQSSAPIKIGFQAHRTGIGASYGRWYERTTNAAVKLINEAGGINGRPVEIVVEDDGTDPKRGAEVVGKFATQHKTDIVYGTLFSHVVIGSAPTAGELKIPYYVVSEGHHVASTKLNRYCFQPGITDVKSQVISMAPWIAGNVGKKVTMIFPDFAFGHDHRDYLPPALKAQGAEVIGQIAIPPTETSFTRYFPQIPAETEVLYHVMVGPAVLTFVKELGEFYGSNRPQLFGFIDSLEAVDINSPGLEFLDGSHFWEGSPRYAQDNDSDAQKAYRAAVGLDENGAAVGDPKDVSTAAHMFGCWETLYVIKKAMEDAGYKGPEDRAKLVEATEALTAFAEGPEHPQGDKTFNGKIHQCFGHQNISKVEGGKLKVVHRTSIEDGMYEAEGDYTTQAL
ncbi:ABC transporter substrate-binding protein [Mesorhizobium sp. 1B3]|uniref:ABC transporter substrate-binding protein n=1 Tax=Mesorhizobium sp. 1B3 TaxID=3243599 RepID=UPI003D988889